MRASITTRRTRRTGASLLLGCLLLTGGLGRWAPAYPADRKPQPYALIAGTVFRENGLSLAGAQLLLEPAGESARNRKLRKMRAVSDARGEFAFRVPAEAAQYRLAAEAPGYQRAERPVQISGEERIDVFFRLQPASNK